MSKKTGIYKITNLENGKIYVGSSCNIYNRWYQHRNSLNKGKHHSIRLQNAWNKYGESKFSFEILEIVERQQLITEEQKYLDLYESHNPNKGYNMLSIAGSNAGKVLSKETKKKISETRKKRGSAKGKNNPMFGRRITEKDHHMYGKTHSAEARQKISSNHCDVSGTKNPRSKLDWDKVNFIRQSYKNGEKSVKELMALYNVGQNTIYNILYNNTWKILDNTQQI